MKLKLLWQFVQISGALIRGFHAIGTFVVVVGTELPEFRLTLDSSRTGP